MDCGHGWRDDNDCDICRPSAVVVAGLRGRITELEAALREILSEISAAPFEPASHVVDTDKISDLLAI